MNSNPDTSKNFFANFPALSTLGTELRTRSDEIEQTRRLPRDLVDKLIDTEVFRMWVPQKFGGQEIPLLDGLAVIEEIASHDGAAGWCAMIGVTSTLLAGFLPEHHAQAIYGTNPRVVTGGAAAPTARATRVDGGLRVSGRWAWGSGTEHCDWVGGGCLVMKEGAPPRPTFVFLEPSQIEFLDTWHAMGLRGTGSTDYQTNDAFVPEGRWVELGIDPPRVPGALYRFPFFGALALGVTAVSLGIARRAIEEFKSLATQKRPLGSRNTLAETQVVQIQLAEAEAAYWSARAFVQQSVHAAWQAAEADALTIEHRRHLRLAATNATLQAARAVDLLYTAAGGSAVYTSGVLQRLFRDIHVATQHAMVTPRQYEIAGRLALGLETDVTYF